MSSLSLIYSSFFKSPKLICVKIFVCLFILMTFEISLICNILVYIAFIHPMPSSTLICIKFQICILRVFWDFFLWRWVSKNFFYQSLSVEVFDLWRFLKLVFFNTSCFILFAFSIFVTYYLFQQRFTMLGGF